MRKNSNSLRNSGTYTSPSTPEYGDNHVGAIHKGWSSERVPLPTNSSRRHVSATALMPFNSGRSFPSKWDDAERWITSPLTSYGVVKASSTLQPHRHVKSKSGPLGASSLMYMPNSSPSVPFMGSSPFITGVLVPEGVCFHYGTGIDPNANSLIAEKMMTRASSVPGLSDLMSESSLPSSQDDKLEADKLAEEADDFRVVSRRDMATQMSPDDSVHTSPRESSQLPSFPLPVPGEEDQNKNSAKVEIRDVQVDKSASISSRPLNSRSRKTKKDSPDADDSVSQPWNVTEATKTMSKEEARISAWENLQKAKAEAAIQKLEMKLEKKRAASMNKILNKLRTAQMKAQEMRGAISEKRDAKVSTKATSFKHFSMFFFSGCFSCHAH